MLCPATPQDGEATAPGRKSPPLSSWFTPALLLVLVRFVSQQCEIPDLCSRDPAVDLLLMSVCFWAPGRSKLLGVRLISEEGYGATCVK